jgi:hypothetical protein
MKIAQVCVGRFPAPVHVGGGDVRRWQDLCSLTTLGHEVHVITCDPTNERASEFERFASSITVHQSAPSLAKTNALSAQRPTRHNI